MNIVACTVIAFMVAASAAFAQNTNVTSPQGGSMSSVTSDIVKSLAPTGTLRVGINAGNPVLVQVGAGGELKGVTVDLAREAAKRLGVPVELNRFDAAGKSFEALKGGKLDIVFLAIEPVRAAEVAFTAPYVIIEGVYMVPKDSAITSNDQVDRAGIRIGVNKASAYDLFLTRNLKHATLVRGEGSLDDLVKQKLEVVAGVKQPLVGYVKAHPDMRLLAGRFMEIQQAMGTVKGRDTGARWLHGFIEELKASGFIADALKRSNQPDAAVAPPA
ncbi:MAG TPA: ABC transporter substrate-binding protein [Xanthobacteraceae bacterium]|nr:ABC transporter substrate-binding protein [Xanthobacteraceae bacterium]